MNDISNAKKLATGTVIYAIGTFGTKILMFLIAPLYTYFLATSEMGTYDVLISTIGLLIPIISLQISDAVYRWIIRENSECAIYIQATYRFLIISSLLGIIFIFIVNQVIAIPYVFFFVGALISSLFFQVSQKIIRGLKRQWLFAISGIVYTCVFLILNILQLCVLHKGVDGLLISYITANIAGLATIAILEKRIRIKLLEKIDYQIIKTLLFFSIPLIPNYLSWWIVDSSDRYIVLWLLGVSSNGILAIAHKFPTILQAVFGLFLNSWQDLAIANEKKEKEFYTSVFRKMYRFSLMMMWILIPITKLFVWFIMGPEYKTACNYIPFYYLGSVFSAFCSFYGVGYLKTKNTKGAFFSSVYGAIINAAVNICLIKIIGLQAAAVSTFVAFFVMWLVREKQNRTELEIQINWRELVFLVIIDVLICSISIVGNLLINGIITLFGVIGFSLFARKEIIEAMNIIKKGK